MQKDCGRVLERKVAWLCGAMLYIMLYGRLPYIDGRLNLRDFVNRTRAVDLVVPDGHHQLPPLLHDLLRGALDSNPETRSSLDAIEVHPWCNSGEEVSGTPAAARFGPGSPAADGWQHKGLTAGCWPAAVHVSLEASGLKTYDLKP